MADCTILEVEPLLKFGSVNACRLKKKFQKSLILYLFYCAYFFHFSSLRSTERPALYWISRQKGKYDFPIIVIFNLCKFFPNSIEN